VFLINSRLGLVTATRIVKYGRPFFRSYGASLPSSLERVLSRPLVFSTNLPVSVSGTGVFIVNGSASFSWKFGVTSYSLQVKNRDNVLARV
jgi:hypothetical protein